MKYLLDTNIVSYWMRGDKGLIDKLSNKRPCDMALSVITYAEILYGIGKSNIKKKERMGKLDLICEQLEILPFNNEAAQYYAEIRISLEKKGGIISERDLQIASIAKSEKLVMVTHNYKEFQRVPGLTIEDWAE